MDSSSPTSTTVHVEQLGPAGIRGELHFLAMTPDERRSDEERLKDTSKRRFTVSALLDRSYPAPGDVKGDFTPEDGSSYMMLPEDQVLSRVRCPEGVFDIKKNSNGEQSYVVFACEATSVAQAKNLFLKGFLPFLDHQAFLANGPVVLSTLRVEDLDNLRTSIDYVSPYRRVTISPHIKRIHAELVPIYAMYRDAKNSHSDFYTFLCYHKILDGLLGTLRTALRVRAKTQKVQLSSRRDVVPASGDVAREYQQWAGKSIKSFFDEVMTPQFRNAVAHFITKDGAVLNLSEPSQIHRYADMVYVSELCVRVVVETHETWLAELGAP